MRKIHKQRKRVKKAGEKNREGKSGGKERTKKHTNRKG